MDFELWRTYLYPLGFIASIAFGARTFVQWIASEKEGRCLVPRSFWQISLYGNAFYALHCFIQLQYPILLIQTINTLLAWRNLDLARPGTRVRYWQMIVALIGALLIVSAAYALYSFASFGQIVWSHRPTLPWHEAASQPLALFWPLIGYTGAFLFAFRFWFQWWQVEHKKQERWPATLGPNFWWMSLAGAFCAFLYFVQLPDPVNALGYGLGIIPYARNLLLLKRESLEEKRNAPLKPLWFFFAGEQSADGRGAELITQLKDKHPQTGAIGVGGPKMRAAGLNCLLPMERFEVMGFSAVLAHLPQLWCAFRTIRRKILECNPQCVILIDYPDFNMLLAHSLRKRGYGGKIIQYVSPTVWAWRPGRAVKLARDYDLLLALFPFEKECYAHTPLPVAYIGHPLVASCRDAAPAGANWRPRHQLAPKSPLIALFPGSRLSEIELNFPTMLKSIELLHQSDPSLSWAVSVANSKTALLIARILRGCPIKEKIHVIQAEETYALMQECHGAIATSGTVTLELALFKVPTVVVYQIAPLNAFLARYVLRIRPKFIALVNILCQKGVFPELIHRDFTAKSAAEALLPLLEGKARSQCLAECARLQTLLSSNYSTPCEGAFDEISKILG